MRIVSTTPDSITVQWESVDDGYSPITRAMLNYKMTYGEWADTEVTSIFGEFDVKIDTNNALVENKIYETYKLIFCSLHGIKPSILFEVSIVVANTTSTLS